MSLEKSRIIRTISAATLVGGSLLTSAACGRNTPTCEVIANLTLSPDQETAIIGGKLPGDLQSMLGETKVDEMALGLPNDATDSSRAMAKKTAQALLDLVPHDIKNGSVDYGYVVGIPADDLNVVTFVNGNGHCIQDLVGAATSSSAAPSA